MRQIAERLRLALPNALPPGGRTNCRSAWLDAVWRRRTARHARRASCARVWRRLRVTSGFGGGFGASTAAAAASGSVADRRRLLDSTGGGRLRGRLQRQFAVAAARSRRCRTSAAGSAGVASGSSRRCGRRSAPTGRGGSGAVRSRVGSAAIAAPAGRCDVVGLRCSAASASAGAGFLDVRRSISGTGLGQSTRSISGREPGSRTAARPCWPTEAQIVDHRHGGGRARAARSCRRGDRHRARHAPPSPAGRRGQLLSDAASRRPAKTTTKPHRKLTAISRKLGSMCAAPRILADAGPTRQADLHI